MSEISKTQMRVLGRMARYPNHLPMQIAGFGMAPQLSAARALVRKGLARAGSKTGHYKITEAGLKAYFEQGNEL